MKRQLFFLAALFLASQARSEIVPPQWQLLTFEGHTAFGVARSEVAVWKTGSSGEAQHWQLAIDNSFYHMRETVTLSIDDRTGSLVERERYSKGRQGRLVSWRYSDSEITRTRREPADDAKYDRKPGPYAWQLESETSMEIPAEIRGESLVSPASLFVILETLVNEVAPRELIAHLDSTFKLLEVTIEEGSLEVEQQFLWRGKPVSGPREVYTVCFDISPLSPDIATEKFRLMGLGKPLEVALDRKTLLPLRVAGDAVLLGAEQMVLVGAVPRELGAVSIAD